MDPGHTVCPGSIAVPSLRHLDFQAFALRPGG